VKRNPDRATDASSPTTPGGWARRLQQGEPDAVHLVRERIQKILRYQGLRIPANDREDIEQEVMTDVWRAVNRDSFDFTAGFWGFVEIVTSRRCIDWMRKKKEHTPLVEDHRDERDSPFERFQSGQRETIASAVLHALDPKCREILVMRFQQGMRYSDISQHLGKSEGAVRVQMHRCVQRAREVLVSGSYGEWQDRRRKDSDETS